MHITTEFRKSFALVGVVAALALTGCMGMGKMASRSSQVTLQPLEQNLGAAGTVGLSSDRNGNTIAEVKVEHLPPPALYSPELATYVVWARGPGADDFTNMGQVVIDDDRDGKTFIRLPYKSFEVLVTAETTGGVLEPSKYRVLEGSVGGAVRTPSRSRDSDAREQRDPEPAQPPTEQPAS